MTISKDQRTIYTSSSQINRRQAAHKRFLEGATIGEVMAELGLKRNTANVYLWEARHMAREQGILGDEDLTK